jgi:DNA-binding response OmpR family regulator
MGRILVIEDEPQMLRGICDNLEFDGHTVETAADGRSGLERILHDTFDLILLDVMLPGLSGYDVCKTARSKGITTPIIMLTARGEEIDKVLGLELGADDYITKPFGLRELLARVKAALRRAELQVASPAERIHLGTLTVDFGAYSAQRNDEDVQMTPKEFDVLKFLWQQRNKTVSRDQLLTTVWGYDDSISTRTVDNFILKLRQKIEADPAHPKYILTIHGLGYKLIA